jgi:hypothetical protein
LTSVVADRALFTLWPKQQVAFDLLWNPGIYESESELLAYVEQVLYGGAAGGAKSHFARALCAHLAILWPGSHGAIFRRTDAELQSNHVQKWLQDVDPFVPGGQMMYQAMEYRWPSPAWCWCEKLRPCPHSSVTEFRHVDNVRGAQKHQGSEFAFQVLDEGTHFTPSDVDFLYTRIRAPVEHRHPQRIVAPNGRGHEYPGWPHWRRLQVITANPGDIGHEYMRDNYIDPESGIELDESGMKDIINGPHQLVDPVTGSSHYMDVYTDPETGEEKDIEVDLRGGQTWTVDIDLGPPMGHVQVNRAYVPARVQDNPALDPLEYAGSLAVGSVELRQRLLDGDWGYSEDKVFKMLSREVHQVDGRRIFGESASGAMRPPPFSWPRGIGQDHGTTKPTAAVWLCQEEEGFLIAYQEYYRPGAVGLHIRGIKELMEWDGHPDLTVEADPRLWHRNQGVEAQISVAAIYQYAGIPPDDPGERKIMAEQGIRLRQAKIEDVAALDALFDLLEPDPERMFPYWHPMAGEYGAPGLFFTENCRMTYREMSNLKHGGMGEDGRYQEGVKTGQADHAFDALKRIAEPFRRRVVAPRRRRGAPRAVVEAV